MRLIDADIAKEEMPNAIKDYMYWLEVQPTVQQWIPVSDRLPENVIEIVTKDEYIRQTKLVTDGEYVTIMIYEDGEFRNTIDRNKICDCITAWMDLPEPCRPD